MQVVTVLLADGQRLLADCLSRALADVRDLQILPERPATASAAVEAAERHRPDVVLLDYWIPDAVMDGAAATRAIVAAAPPPRVLLLSWAHGPHHVQAALEAGAAGFLPKSLGLDELVEAVRLAHAGEALVYGEQLAKLVEEIERRADQGEEEWARVQSLSPRELEILRLLTEGRPLSEVAASLAMKNSSLRTRIHKIIRKLGVRTQAEAVTIARRQGVVTPSCPAGTTLPVPPAYYWTP